MLACASGQFQGPAEGKGPREKIQEAQLCDVILSPRGLDVGTISAHVIKHYLFMRGLLPAQFDELANLLRQESAVPETKSRRTTNSAAKRTQKLLNSLTGTFATLSGLDLQKEPVTVLALLGPSPSRPREVLEIVFCSLPHPDEAPEIHDGQHRPFSAEAIRKACCKTTRKLVPLLNSLPLPKAAGSTKMFVAVAGHSTNENLQTVHDRYVSLKQCKSWTILRVGSTAKASALQHLKSFLQLRVQRQLMGHLPENESSDDPCLAFCNAAVPSLSFTSDVYV